MEIVAGLRSAWAAMVAARNAIITGSAVAGLCLPLGYCKGVSAERARQSAALALASTKALEADAHHKDVAAAERVADAMTINAREEDLIDAIQDVPDSKPSRVRVALGCQRLRQAGRAEADLPAICRPGSGH